jgi:hypothetical protein
MCFLLPKKEQSSEDTVPPPLKFGTRNSAMKTLLALVIMLAVLPNVTSAKTFESQKNGQEVVAHTSRAPVIVHKIFPPYGLHKHVYAGSLPK